MKKIGFVFLLFVLSFGVAHAQNTLFDGWISLSSAYLGDNEYQYNYSWGANTTLSQTEIDNLFPYEQGPYMGDGRYLRQFSGIGTSVDIFWLSWENPVDIIWTSTIGNDMNWPSDITGISGESLCPDWLTRAEWERQRAFSFRTKGYMGTQNIDLQIVYYASYNLVSGNDRVGCVLTSGGLDVARSFEPIPEPGTLLLLGFGLLGLAGFARFRPRNKG